MWIQLIRPYRIIEPGGRPVMHEPGEMLAIKNKAKAKSLIQDGFAVDVAGGQGAAPDGCGVAIRGKITKPPGWIDALNLGSQVIKDVRELPYGQTIVWHPGYEPNCLQLIATFKAMRTFTWDIAVPIKSYAKLTKDLGTEADRKRTEAIIHDLRVPYYNTHLLFVRRNETTQLLMGSWYKEMRDGGDECLAFMRALYQIKPLILPLPVAAVKKRPR